MRRDTGSEVAVSENATSERSNKAEVATWSRLLDLVQQ
jgi:hypothetical protein